jgi:hypothetical protein
MTIAGWPAAACGLGVEATRGFGWVATHGTPGVVPPPTHHGLW